MNTPSWNEIRPQLKQYLTSMEVILIYSAIKNDIVQKYGPEGHLK